LTQQVQTNEVPTVCWTNQHNNQPDERIKHELRSISSINNNTNKNYLLQAQLYNMLFNWQCFSIANVKFAHRHIVPF
jgi:hypothetical protein